MQLRHNKKRLFDGVNFGSLFDLLGDFYGHLFALLAGFDRLVVKLHGSNSVREFLFSTPYFYLTPNFETLVQLNTATPSLSYQCTTLPIGFSVVKLNKA